MLSDKIVPTTLVDSIAEKVELAIIHGELTPRSRISEAQLARDLGVSRGPLREALSRLEGRKLIERTPNYGPRVVSLSAEDVVELFAIREALEGMACRLAAEKATQEDLARLEAVLASQVAPRTSDDPFDTQDADFHFQVARAAGNRKLSTMLCDELYALLRIYRYRSGLRHDRRRQGYTEHVEIFDAIKGRDPDRAEAAMRRHIAKARENLWHTVGQETAI